ncbi:MAG: 4-hydroxy-tetrahydrodipicolinate synthase [Elusimicrobia bacterium]|nr:4-hydroxy-tetrahydrodipicolinate synthase [Elusimicrobiota bacterium]
MTRAIRFEGSYPALITPMRGGALDETAYRALVCRQIQGGSAGLVPCGSTGEAATLAPAEYKRLVQIAVEEAAGKIPVIAGVGTNATWRAVEEAHVAAALGADALLVLAPYYNKPTQEGLYRHFKEVAGAVRLPIVVYNIPGRTAVNIQPSTIARMAKDCGNIVAVKEAAGSLDQVSEILTLCPAGFTVLSGDDSLTLPMLSVGARGVISVVANLIPKDTARLCSSYLRGDTEKARKLHLEMFPLVKSLFIETNPIPLKAAAAMMGLCAEEIRLPLTPISAESRTKLRAALKSYGLLRR